jgi:hypothetical protein
MKNAIRGVLFNLTSVLFFSMVYYLFKEDFRSDQGPVDLLDCMFLSTTIQAGVGYTILHPTSYFSKLVLLVQQVCMLATNVFLLYFLVA